MGHSGPPVAQGENELTTRTPTKVQQFPPKTTKHQLSPTKKCQKVVHNHGNTAKATIRTVPCKTQATAQPAINKSIQHNCNYQQQIPGITTPRQPTPPQIKQHTMEMETTSGPSRTIKLQHGTSLRDAQMSDMAMRPRLAPRGTQQDISNRGLTGVAPHNRDQRAHHT